MSFIVFDSTYTPDSKRLYVQFSDECATLEDARKLARFKNLRGPSIEDLDAVERG